MSAEITMTMSVSRMTVSRLCQLSYRRMRDEPAQLSRLPMRCMTTAARAELRELDAIRIVLPVLLGAVGARPAGRAGQRDDRAVVLCHLLFQDLRDHARAHGVPTLADGEAHSGLQGDRGAQGHLAGDVVPGHDHLRTLGQLHIAGHVGGAQVELRAVAREEGGVPATLLL